MITRHEIDVSRQNKVKYVVNDVVDLFHNMMVPQDEEFVFDDVIWPAARSTSSSRTTPGTIGSPGKCPASAGWSAAIRPRVSVIAWLRLPARPPSRAAPDRKSVV